MRYRCHTGEYPTRRDIDVAIGILVGLTRCSPERAFDRLAAAVHRTGIGLGTMSAALIAVAGRDSRRRPDPTAVVYWEHTVAELADVS